MFEVKIDLVKTNSAHLHVVRDDRLGGGTKERACRPFLRTLMQEGAREFLYASPFCGFAQVAIAKCASELRARCTIYAEEAPGGGAHEFTELARSFGAQIVLASSLPQAQAMAARDERNAFAFREVLADGSEISHRSSVRDVPLGFDHPAFHRAFRLALQDAWAALEPLNLKRVWLPVGSGTFARCFRSIMPAEIELCLVDVGVLPTNDLRISSLAHLPNTNYVRTRELFTEAARTPPPIPSNIHYDAKLWAFLDQHAREGDLWWNVAR
jgi:hypothetical protein